jgi:hypothetical protein
LIFSHNVGTGPLCPVHGINNKYDGPAQWPAPTFLLSFVMSDNLPGRQV